MSVIPIKMLQQRIKYTLVLEFRVLSLKTFKAILCFYSYKHKWGQHLGKSTGFQRNQVNCLCFQIDCLVFFLFFFFLFSLFSWSPFSTNCVFCFSHIWLYLLIDLVSDWFFLPGYWVHVSMWFGNCCSSIFLPNFYL